MDVIRTSPLQCVAVVTVKNVDDTAHCIFCVFFMRTYVRNLFLISVSAIAEGFFSPEITVYYYFSSGSLISNIFPSWL